MDARTCDDGAMDDERTALPSCVATPSRSSKRRGWLLVIALGGPVILGFGMFVTMLPNASTDTARARKDVEQLLESVHEYESEHGGQSPVDLEELLSPDGAGFAYVASIPRDPWNQAYGYDLPSPGFADARVWSCGPDGRPGGGDDIETRPPDPSYATTVRAREDLHRLFDALEEYAFVHDGRYPDSLDDLCVPDAYGERILDSRHPPGDPWNASYRYAPPSPSRPHPCVWSDGPDHVPGGGDDVGSRP
jgi:hypothetical protein